ncbi:hypothetical protein [Fluviispira multicolorata]|uniref:Uncharacterized protein n=1 Tax=Fluviispira multicolorata TaxID=2654512 RepID=A0A833JAG7_9BACT|nr:hypothetical protein [Fluviispira multicolorata]KAB8028054.1 hypothetical protein GCL57_13460 [Fluviispira multicolorata]
MKIQFQVCSFLAMAIVQGCGGNPREEIKENIIYIPRPQVKTKLNTKILKPAFNKDGTYSSLNGFWTVPDNVYSVKMIGCSGGNGGGGGGAGGAGAGLFTGNWNGNSLGGNGSAGGDANGIVESGERGNPGKRGHICDERHNVLKCTPFQNSFPGFQAANSATKNGESGKLGEISEFGDFKFQYASQNIMSIVNNNSLSGNLTEHYKYCSGGAGGKGGKGGVGASVSLGDQNTKQYGGFGGDGGHGKDGFAALVQEHTLQVQPGQVISYKVGIGGNGGIRSDQAHGGQVSRGYPNGQAAQLGTNGVAGNPGVLVLQWVSTD